MRYPPVQFVRARAAVRLLAALSALVAAAPAAGEAARDPRGLLVPPPRVDAELAPLTAGIDRWQRERLASTGLRVVAAPAAFGFDTAAAGARDRNLAYALLSDARVEAGQVEVRLVLVAAADAGVFASARERGPLVSLGASWDAAIVRILSHLDAPNTDRASPPPQLGDLSDASRVDTDLRAGSLYAAWSEVEGKISPLALKLQREIVERAQSGSGDRWERARVIAAAGDAPAAWRLIESALEEELAKKRPDPAHLLVAAEVQIARKRPREASGLLSRAAELAPGRADESMVRSHLLLARGDVTGARAALAHAVEIDGGDPRRITQLAELETDPVRRADLYLRAAEGTADRLDANRARGLYARAVEIEPALAARVSTRLAVLEEKVGRPAEALAAYRRAQKAGVDDAATWRGVARNRAALGDDTGAGGAWERALALDPDDAEALRERGRQDLDANRAAAALPRLERALELAPDDRATRRTLADALRRGGQAERAVSTLEASISGPDPDPDDLRTWSALREQQGDVGAARAAMLRAVRIDPLDPSLHEELARLHTAAGDAEAANEEAAFASRLVDDAPAASGLPNPPEDAPAAAAVSFDDLVRSFSDGVRDAARSRVVLLGVRDAKSVETIARDWLDPRAPDLEAIDAALAAAIARQFRLVDADWSAAAYAHEEVDGLFAFDSRDSVHAAPIAHLNSVLGSDAVFVARLVRNPVVPEEPGAVDARCADPGHYELEARMLSGQEPEFVSILVSLECLPDGRSLVSTWNVQAVAVWSLVALLLAFPIVRGWGTLVVTIKLPPKTRGFFAIHIRRRPDQIKVDPVQRKKPGSGERLRRRLSSFSHYERRMAGPRNVFRWIPARRRPYYVTVKGPLLAARGDEIIGNFLQEQPIQVVRGKEVVLGYDFRPTECAVEVHVYRGDDPARGARIAVRGMADSLRYAPEGHAFLYLGTGRYTIVVGGRDSVCEREIALDSLQEAVRVDIDLGDERSRVFEGCAEAVEPFLLGDFATAAPALAAAGQSQAAARVRAMQFRERGDHDQAATCFEEAGLIEAAALERALGSDARGSAALYERAGDLARAADAYRAAGDWLEAGRCYEAAYDFDDAIECYREAHDDERVVDVLEKCGAYLEAASVARSLGDGDRAIRDLQQVDRWGDGYGEACRVLAEIMSERGDFDLAAGKIAEAIASAGDGAAPVSLLVLQADFLEKAGRVREALEAWEGVRSRDPLHDEAPARIAALRERCDDAPSPVSASAQTAPAVRESRYELLGELGRGGMGVVFKARDKRLGRVVALKRLPENLRQHPTAVKLFNREAQAAAALNHPNIVTLFDADEENGSFFITMELLEGLPLNAILEKRRRLSARDAARIGVQAAAGLEYAHSQRIVHRDIKTSNLFFTREKTVKIMDFGLAKTIEEVRRNSTIIGGTPYFMAPEQASGEPVDHRTDLYAFGVTLFHLVTGDLPFREGDLAYHHRHTEPPDPRTLVPELPDALAGLILRLLAKDPAGRAESAAEIQEILRAAI